jgi:hypothetical protein
MPQPLDNLRLSDESRTKRRRGTRAHENDARTGGLCGAFLSATGTDRSNVGARVTLMQRCVVFVALQRVGRPAVRIVAQRRSQRCRAADCIYQIDCRGESPLNPEERQSESVEVRRWLAGPEQPAAGMLSPRLPACGGLPRRRLARLGGPMREYRVARCLIWRSIGSRSVTRRQPFACNISASESCCESAAHRGGIATTSFRPWARRSYALKSSPGFRRHID